MVWLWREGERERGREGGGGEKKGGRLLFCDDCGGAAESGAHSGVSGEVKSAKPKKRGRVQLFTLYAKKMQAVFYHGQKKREEN